MANMKGGTKRLKALYVGDTRKVDKVMMFYALLTTIESRINETRLKDEKYKIRISEKVTVDTLGKRCLSDFNVIVCSRGVYLDHQQHFDVFASSRLVVVFANEKIKDAHNDVVIVSIKDGIPKQIKGDMFFIPDA